MHFYAHVDWVSVTYMRDVPVDAVFPHCVYFAPFNRPGPTLYGYSRSLLNENGAIILSAGRPEQGVHCILPGDALTATRAEGLSDRDLCAFFEREEARASRIDLAINILDGKMTVSDLRDAFRLHDVVTSARSATEVAALHAPDHTLYIGSRQSDRFFRAYNKAAQIKDENAWLRLELECKRLVARATLPALAADQDSQSFINAAIADFIDFPTLPEFQAATAARSTSMPIVPRKITATYRWLIGTVAPCLARYEHEHPNDPVAEAFLAAWQIALKRLKSESRNAGGKEP
jgi:hypothetical protein